MSSQPANVAALINAHETKKIIEVDAPWLADEKKNIPAPTFRFKTSLTLQEYLELVEDVGRGASPVATRFFIEASLFQLCAIDDSGEPLVPRNPVDPTTGGYRRTWLDDQVAAEDILRIALKAKLYDAVLRPTEDLFDYLGLKVTKEKKESRE